MATLKSVVDLLAEQQEPVLLQMRDSFRSDLARIQVELQQVEQALAKKARRGGRTPTGDRSDGDGSRRLTRWQVFEVLQAQGRPMSPAEVKEALVAQGHTGLNTAQVRNHLTRLADKNKTVMRLSDLTYVVPSSNGTTPKNETDEPLSRADLSQRQDSLTDVG